MSNVLFAQLKRELWIYSLYVDTPNGATEYAVKFVQSLEHGRKFAEDNVAEFESVGTTIVYARLSRANIFYGDENPEWFTIHEFDGHKWTEKNELRKP